MRTLAMNDLQLISGGKNDNMTVNISLSVPVADAALFTGLYAQITSGAIGLTEFGQALADAKLTNVVFTNFHLSQLHYDHSANQAASSKN